MAEIVLGLGTSHTPQLSSPPETWWDHARRDEISDELIGTDRELHSYQDLVRTAPGFVRSKLTLEHWEEEYARAQFAIEQLSTALTVAKPDVIVVIGNDQGEIFREECLPAFAIVCGAELVDLPVDPDELERMGVSIKSANWATHSESRETYPGSPEIANHLIRALVDADFDVCQVNRQAGDRALSHAYTFVQRRLMASGSIPMLAIMVSSYSDKSVNQPSPARCLSFGRSLRGAIESWDGPERIAIAVSGGLSHFVIDEELDRMVCRAIESGQPDELATLPRETFQSGTAEILNWIAGAGALEVLSPKIIDYVPAYRTAAGTGVGMCFALWQPSDGATS